MLDEPFTGWVTSPAENQTCSCFGKSEFDLRLDNKSRMSREVHVRFCEGLGVRFPRATRLVVLCRSQSEAEAALAMITQWVEQAGLTLHLTKTKIVDSRSESFAFLGYSFRGDKIYPRRESLVKMKVRIKELTSRKRPGSIHSIAKELNRVLVGWFGYFRHCRWTIFKDLDAQIRSRLRRLLLKRHRENPQRLPRQQRWPNDYFAKAGLYSLREAHFRFDQSVAGNY